MSAVKETSLKDNTENNDSEKQVKFAPGQSTSSKNARNSKAVARQKSMYDHVEIDFVKSGKKTFLFRLIVAGMHEDDPADLMRTTKMMIDEINASCHDELATGFLLVYPHQFIHVLEGSEDTLNQYLARCAEMYEKPGGTEMNKVSGDSKRGSINTSERPRSPKVKMLVLGYFAIQDRILPRWLTTRFNPPRDPGEIDGGFRKNLFDLVRTTLILAVIMSKQPTMKNGEIDWPGQSDGPKSKERREQESALMQYLPSMNTIMFILHHKSKNYKLKTPQEFIKSFWEVPNLILSSETTWPVPCRMAPYD